MIDQKHNNGDDASSVLRNRTIGRRRIHRQRQRQSTRIIQNILCMLSISCILISSLIVQSFTSPSFRPVSFPFHFRSSSGINSDDSITIKTASTTSLFATGSKKKKKRPTSKENKSVGGFGGAAMEVCPCGSEDVYSKCCGKIHSNVNAFRLASPEQVVRARYSAYAKKKPEFLMASTHPKNKAFDPDLKRWKDTIK